MGFRKKKKAFWGIQKCLACTILILGLYIVATFLGVTFYLSKRMIHRAQLKDSEKYRFDRNKLEEVLKMYGRSVFHRPLTAYTEPPMDDRIPGTGSRGPPNDPVGTYPSYKTPLPLRKTTPADLRVFQYDRIRNCDDLPAKLPVDRGRQYDEKGEQILWNIGGDPDISPEEEAAYCPVDMDPFLPWIHDVFPSVDGSAIQFVGQNKRRCRTGMNQTSSIERLIPQVTLMQAVSVQRIEESKARSLASELWVPESGPEQTRYRLVPIEEADADGQFTRFICRFTTIDPESRTSVIVGETLSRFPFNYEFVSYRKGGKALWTAKGKDSTIFWTSVLRFECPVPEEWQTRVRNGDTILSDGTPTLFVDLIPIRTSPRTTEVHLSTDMIGPVDDWIMPRFDPLKGWGTKQIIPRIEASGRLENVPICKPPSPFLDETKSAAVQSKEKTHFLSACLWASAQFKTRGSTTEYQSDTQTRLKEWITFHLMVGFDHIYVFDNSGAHTNETDLSVTTDLFPDQVTRIDWPSTVCNNNPPAHDSCGERSSQYAAENACRTRYAPFTEWIMSFDTDEYITPMGDYKSMKDVLKDASKGGTKILSFKSSRGRLRRDHSYEEDDMLIKKPDSLFLEAYNCDRAGLQKPGWATRAKKQAYLSDYLLYHWVHFSTITFGMLKTYKDTIKAKEEWQPRIGEHPPVERVVRDASEATMIHAKEVPKAQTANFKKVCHHEYKKKTPDCQVAFPWPSVNEKEGAFDSDGFLHNCHINEKVESTWIPALKRVMAKQA